MWPNFAGNCGIGHIYWKKTAMENFIICAVESSDLLNNTLILNAAISFNLSSKRFDYPFM